MKTVDDVNIPVYITDILRDNHIKTLNTLLEYSVNDLLAIDGMGISYCRTVCECLVLHGYTLRPLPRDR